MLTSAQALVMIGVMALFTLFTRAIAFLLFPADKPTPAYIEYLGKALPSAIIGMLIVYCLKDVTPAASPYGIPEAISVLAVVLLHLWRRSSLLSIAGGTILYMVLVQVVFA